MIRRNIELAELAECTMLNDAWILLDRCLSQAIEAIEARIHIAAILEAINIKALDRLREEAIVKHSFLMGLKSKRV